MGTSNEWIKVVLLGGLWGLSMILSSAHRRTSMSLKTAWYLEEVLSWLLMGLCFGIVVVFPLRRAFSMPLVFVTVAAFVGSCVVGMIGDKRHAVK